MSYKNEKDWQYIVLLFNKTYKDIFSYGLLQYENNLDYTMSFNVFEVPSGSFTIEASGIRLRCRYLT